MSRPKRTARRRFLVGIPKVYFPRHLWPKGVGESYTEVHRVFAVSRTEAAQVVWSRHGGRLLREMLPGRQRVSLDVNEPAAGVGGILGRLAPITVYSTPKR